MMKKIMLVILALIICNYSYAEMPETPDMVTPGSLSDQGLGLKDGVFSILALQRGAELYAQALAEGIAKFFQKYADEQGITIEQLMQNIQQNIDQQVNTTTNTANAASAANAAAAAQSIMLMSMAAAHHP